jgi:hypothetical protein
MSDIDEPGPCSDNSEYWICECDTTHNVSQDEEYYVLDVKPLTVTLIMKTCRNKQLQPIHQLTETTRRKESCALGNCHGFRLVEIGNTLISVPGVTGRIRRHATGRGRGHGRRSCSVKADAHQRDHSTRGTGRRVCGRGGCGLEVYFPSCRRYLNYR